MSEPSKKAGWASIYIKGSFWAKTKQNETIQPTNQLNNQPTNQPTDRPTDRPTNQPTNQIKK